MPNHKGLEMYFNREVAEKFAELEQNDKNFRVAEIVDRAIIQEMENIDHPIYAAELGGGAHPDRYHNFFARLIKEGGHVDWVDVSPFMLELADKYISDEKYQDRKNVISFIEEDFFKYLEKLEDEKLDLGLMKYTIDHVDNLENLFELLSKKLKTGAKLIATIQTDPKLKSYSTNARYFYNGEQFPDNETRELKDGDNFTIKFFKVSGDPDSGYLEGAETVKYFHSAEKIKELAQKFGFEVYLGDWKNFVKEHEAENMDQEIMVLTKK